MWFEKQDVLCAAYFEVFYCYDVKTETSFSRQILIQEFHARFNKSGSVRINVTLRGVRVTIVALEIQSVIYILSVCM
jgi:hypothetical protein